jgi:hypothetical protein
MKSYKDGIQGTCEAGFVTLMPVDKGICVDIWEEQNEKEA